MKWVELPDDVIALYAERAARSGRSLVDEVVAKLLDGHPAERETPGRTYRLKDDSIDALLFGEPEFQWTNR